MVAKDASTAQKRKQPSQRSKEAMKTTNFGFKEIEASAKAPLVAEIFHSVAGKYDLMNDLMSLGAHRIWKAGLIRATRPHPNRHLLDVAGGTGDIARAFLEAGGGRATLVDINLSMVEAGIDTAINQGMIPNVSRLLPDYVIGDAEKLPIADHSVDLYTIAFGLRNVTHIEQALKEAKRVLKPGGKFFCLEFSKVILPVFEQIYDQYSFILLPKLGKFITGDEAAYRYLVESIRKFPPQQELIGLMEAAGLKKNSYETMSLGAVSLHSGWSL